MGEPRTRRSFRRIAVSALVVMAAGIEGCGRGGETGLVLAATTSTHDSGLLDTLVARFEATHPDLRVRTVVVGSGEALELGRRGDVDVLLVHAPSSEERFMREGHGLSRTPVMYNDFIIVGPPDDPAAVRGLGHPATALKTIAERGAPFVSRGDSSGTHVRELELWRALGVAPMGGWYLETGQGQGTSLHVASERRAYTLTDRATYSQLRSLVRLDVLVEGDPALLNLYSVILPAETAHAAAGAAFADWLTSSEGRGAIAGFRTAAGEVLFTPLLLGAELPIPAPHADDDTVSASP